MGKFLGVLVAIPSIRRLRIVGPYKNMVWFISATDNSSSAFLRPVLLRQTGCFITQSKQLFDSLTARLSRPIDSLVIPSRTHV